MERNIRVARAMAAAAGDAPFRIALNDCGAIPFYTDWPTVDLAGLSNRKIALAGTADAVIHEIRTEKPELVILVARQRHGRTALFGWERITAQQVEALGYDYLGNLEIAADYHLLLFGGHDSRVRAFAARLSERGILETPER
jgi:hypothetical protein